MMRLFAESDAASLLKPTLAASACWSPFKDGSQTGHSVGLRDSWSIPSSDAADLPPVGTSLWVCVEAYSVFNVH